MMKQGLNLPENDTSWKTPTFRQNVVSKIEEAIRQSGMPTSKTSIEMENHVFQKAKCRDEYLGFVARLILHVREMNATKNDQNKTGPAITGPQKPSVQDPINALRTLAHQGGGNQGPGMGQQSNQQQPLGSQQQVTATNLLQTLNQGQRTILQNKAQASMGSQIGSMVQQGQIVPGPPVSQMNMVMSNQIPRQINNSTGGSIPGNAVVSSSVASSSANHVTTALPNQVTSPMTMGPSMPVQMGNQIPFSGAQIRGLIPGHIIRQTAPDGTILQQQNQNFMGPRIPMQNQFARQSAPSPIQQQPSPASMISNSMVPSPNAHAQMMVNAAVAQAQASKIAASMAPSPSNCLSVSTPLQDQSSPSPMEEQMYTEKVRQMRDKYGESLERMVAQIDPKDQEKMNKLKKLLEILNNPGKRMPLETVLKCEKVLEKLDLKRQPLLEAVSMVELNPYGNHTLHRTFGYCLDAIYGPPIASMPPPLKRKKIDDIPPDDIPDVLQGEIARLDQRFKVSLSPEHIPSSKVINLLCSLDDKHLPCVPPINIIVPIDYPISSPQCKVSNYERGSTKFLSTVHESLELQISRLPRKYSVSQLLDAWEMSVRQALAPNADEILKSAKEFADYGFFF